VGSWGAQNADGMMEPKWAQMVGVSFAFHLAALCMIVFLANSGPSIRPFRGISYEVNLVELPGGGLPTKAPGPSAAVTAKPEISPPKEAKAQRIEEPKRVENPVVIAKKTVENPTPQPVKPKESPADLINKAISKIQQKAKSENVDHLNSAIAKLQSRAKTEQKPGGGGGGGSEGAGQGISGGPMALYQMEVEAWIKRNWSYPIALDKKNLEAVVVLMVKQDGTIMKTRLEKRSASTLFDESVLKAIERSNPLPPFPDSYRKSYEEFEINFNLKDLEGR
jgi:colicin import membrane protein